MEPTKGKVSEDPAKVKKPNPPGNEEMDAPNAIGESRDEANITPESEQDVLKETEKSEDSSEQNKEISETLGIDDKDLETNEENVVN